MTETHFYIKLIVYLAFVNLLAHWLCGAHQQWVLVMWVSQLQFYDKEKNLLTEANSIRSQQ